MPVPVRKHAFKFVARKAFNTSSSFCKKQRRSSNSDDSMALAYADHSVARKHLCADQNVARTRCEYTQLQGCIVSMCDVCWHRVSAIYDSYVACLLYMIVFSPNRFNHVHDTNNGGGNMHNSRTAWQSWNYTCTTSGYTGRAFKTGSRCQNAKIAFAKLWSLQAGKIRKKMQASDLQRLSCKTQ